MHRELRPQGARFEPPELGRELLGIDAMRVKAQLGVLALGHPVGSSGQSCSGSTRSLSLPCPRTRAS